MEIFAENNDKEIKRPEQKWLNVHGITATTHGQEKYVCDATSLLTRKETEFLMKVVGTNFGDKLRGGAWL
jgi:hypothetical protein